MSGKQWLSLLILFVGYLLLGASLFWHIELHLEVQRRAQQMEEEEEIYALLVSNFNSSEGSLEDLLNKLESYCGKAFSSDPDDPEPLKWHFYNAVFFVITVVSTIGYGNLAPTCMLSRLLMIAYGLIGIPLNGILLTHMANFFGHFFLIAHEKYKMHRIENKIGLIGNILLYLIPGFLVFIICPAFLISMVEGWTFDESVYYAFVTLTTIGFGDYVAGQGDESGVPYSLYKAFLILWVVFGLGYLVMLLGFITRALRSKRMARLEHKLSRNIKQTQNKLWNGFVSEIGYFRRVLNELYLMKLKPVYHDDDVSLATLELNRRSASCPDLRFLGASGGAGTAGASRRSSRSVLARPRAYSEALPGRPLLLRRRSETELAKIDRHATFADTAPPADSGLDPAELLQEFMNALVNWEGGAEDVYDTKHKQGPGTAMPGGGYLGFPDTDILSSERMNTPAATRTRVSSPGPSPWPPTLGPGIAPVRPGLGTRARARAMSLAPFSVATEERDRFARAAGLGREPPQQDDHDSDESTLPADELPAMEVPRYNAEWTWSGAAASRRVHELIRARQNRRQSEATLRLAMTPRTTRTDRKLQDLQQFQHQQYLEQQRQLTKERKQLERRLAGRSKSTSAADPDPDTVVAPPRLVTRIKDLARRGSLQPQPLPQSPQRTVTSGDGVSAHRYRTQSAGERRASVFSMRRDSCTVHPMLENTSLADFLRVLQSVHTQHSQQNSGTSITPAQANKTRKLGTAGLQPQPNSIFNLFPSLREDKDTKQELKERPRRMSFWPSSTNPASQATRKLSAMFGGGGGGGGSADTTALQPKPVRRRRFSIWPTLGYRAEDDEEAGMNEKTHRPEDEAVEHGLISVVPAPPPPQITISYVSDTPPPPTPVPPPPPPAPPREALRRIALSNTSVPLASLGDLPVIVASAAGVPVQDPRRRGPSVPSAAPSIALLQSSDAAFRRRAHSDVTAKQAPKTPPDEETSDNETYDVRL